MPRLALSVGDPAGIGPEIAARVLAAPPDGIQLLAIADEAALAQGAAVAGVALDLPAVDDPRSLEGPVGRLAGVAAPEDEVAPGEVSRAAGAASHAWVVAGAGLAQEGAVDALVTGPIHKRAWEAAGVPQPGHTEVLRDLSGVPHVLMCFVAGRLRAALATIHVPLATVPGRLSEGGVRQDLRLLAKTIPSTRPGGPRLAVCGLNPHAGEGGRFGAEDDAILAPAIQAAQAEGIDAVGPLPADAALPQGAAGRFDAVLAMYHDQALPAVKCLAPRESVNTTLGLPFVRTSVDHGTAFDIAGRGIADERSLRAAIDEAVRMAARNMAAR